MVPVVALAWNTDASAPALRVRLQAIAALTSQALLAQNDFEGRCGALPEPGGSGHRPTAGVLTIPSSTFSPFTPV